MIVVMSVYWTSKSKTFDAAEYVNKINYERYKFDKRDFSLDTLSNGLKYVVVKQSEKNVSDAVLTIDLQVGSQYETEKNPGIASVAA